MPSCTYYLQGSCRFGAACKFRHPLNTNHATSGSMSLAALRALSGDVAADCRTQLQRRNGPLYQTKAWHNATSVADPAPSCEACVPEAADGASLARSPAGNVTHEGQRALTIALPRTAAAAAPNRDGAGGDDPPKGADSRIGSSPQPPLAESYIAREPFGNELLGFKAAGFVLFRLSETGAPRLLVAKE